MNLQSLFQHTVIQYRNTAMLQIMNITLWGMYSYSPISPHRSMRPTRWRTFIITKTNRIIIMSSSTRLINNFGLTIYWVGISVTTKINNIINTSAKYSQEPLSSVHFHYNSMLQYLYILQYSLNNQA